ncbi:mycoredoxin [Corynebacterium sp. ES2715-CONJ3]|uniref:mycoredoxin n=1 Tax=Corynebacterium sp. ES2715-CONJ3 TaxID=2974028 RepID=UPI00216765EE|nr:mycoredoxin [Corynebacterium sp. ES2715-CONJ3]MCS4491594.1 mycoredoxin [Corynebacterium sp. ES2715-CONJ3]
MSSTPITIYATSWCPFCRRLLADLDHKNIPYTTVDVDADATAAAWVESVNSGNRVVPTVLYSDGSHATNPPAGQVARRYKELSAL